MKQHSMRRHAQETMDNRVKALRFELGLTRVELAKLAELSEKTIDRVECGNQALRETTYRKVFNALNKARVREGLPLLVYHDLFFDKGAGGNGNHGHCNGPRSNSLPYAPPRLCRSGRRLGH